MSESIPQTWPDAKALSLMNVALSDVDYPTQPRSFKPREYIQSLSENIKANGQKVPVIGWFLGKRFQLGDGGCRLDAVKLLGWPTIIAMVLPKEPDKGELLIAQASIDLHREQLPPVDRAHLWRNIMEVQKLNGKETAKLVGVSESRFSRTLPLVNLAEDLKALVNGGKFDESKASLIAIETKDPERQRELARAAMGMTRDALAASLRNKAASDQQAVRVNRIVGQMPSGAKVVISGPELSLEESIEAAAEYIREAKKAKEQGLDCKTFMRVCADKARANGKTG